MVDTATTSAPADAGTTGAATGTEWFTSLPVELQSEKSLESFKGKPIAEVAKSYVEAQKLVGGSIRLPKPDAKPEDRAAFTQDTLRKLGVPESPDQYAVTKPAIPEGVPWDDNASKAFLAEAHKLHLLPEQVQGVLNWYGGLLSSGSATQQQAMQAGMSALRTEWGQDYDGKYAQAVNLVEKYGGEELIQELELRGKANSPKLLKFLAKIGEAFGEPKMIRGDAGVVATQEQAKTKIAAINNDKNHPYWKGDKQAVEEMAVLFKQAAGADANKVIVQRN